MAMLLAVATTASATTPTRCRLSGVNEPEVEREARRVLAAYARLDRHLLFTTVIVNREAARDDTLSIEIIAPPSSTCPASVDDMGEVDGLCVAGADGRPVIRCSAPSIAALITKSEAAPALFYVLAHEIGHLFRRDEGSFLSDVTSVPLRGARSDRLQALKTACGHDPQLREEEAADRLTLDALIAVLPTAPLRQPLLSARGSLYWNVDEILLAANRIQKLAAKRPGKLHPQFDLDRVPLPGTPRCLDWAAERFVCDALSSRTPVRYPLRASTHPAPEQRLRRIAERVTELVATVSDDGSGLEYKRRVGVEAASELQQNVGAILQKLIEEEGEYLEQLHSRVCSIVNLNAAALACATVSKTAPRESSP